MLLVVALVAASGFALVLWSGHRQAAAIRSVSMKLNAQRTSVAVALAQAQKAADELKAAARQRFQKAASEALDTAVEIETAIQNKTEAEAYGQKIVSLSARVDNLLAVGDETGLYKSDADAREFCKTMTAVFVAHTQALGQWNLETARNQEKDAARAVHQEKIDGGADAATVAQSASDLTNRLNTLTNEVMAAIDARYSLWKDAQQKTESAKAALARFAGRS